ncbi:MAG TPA: sigma-70 family RNA polymerase sigma factor [Vicinamibacteria bacterium]|nr:sigma-70 family RNA polymerase sigma factor [Vicinamibacteria bacterium]
MGRPTVAPDGRRLQPRARAFLRLQHRGCRQRLRRLLPAISTRRSSKTWQSQGWSTDHPTEIALAQEDGAGRILLSPTEHEAEDAERALVEACRRGEASAFEELYRQHGGRMKSVAMNLLGNTSDAEDAVQEAFLKLYRGLPAFRGGSLLSTWLYRILVNTCRDLGRRRARSPEVPEEAVDGAAAPSRERGAPAVDQTLRLTLERLLLRLDPLPRTVFVLFEIEGFKHREIALILGIPEGTSRYALFEAKKALQTAILTSRRARAET